MGFFSKLFGSFKKSGAAAEEAAQAKPHTAPPVSGKGASAPVSVQTLFEIFATYFAPNKDFYSTPGSPKYIAYFNAVNTAREEMFKNQTIFREATHWSTESLMELVANPKPGFTNMMICSLIFKTGAFAVVQDALLCVDFSEAIPNCIALYLLLTAQKMPAGSRKQVIDAGEGTDTAPLSRAMEALKVCDPDWNYKIF